MARKKSIQRRQQILDAAYKIFAEKGYHQTGIADIATELGLGHGTFYRYFQNKLDIFDNVVDMVIQRIGGVVAVENPSATDSLDAYREQTERIGRRLFDLFTLDEHLSKVLFYEALGITPELNAKVQEAMDQFGRLTEMYLTNGVSKGFLAPDLDTHVTARAINAMIFEGLRQSTLASTAVDVREAWMKAVIRLMFQGMKGE